MKVRNDIKEFLTTIPEGVTLVAATKYLAADEMITFLDNGVNNFGENRVEAFLEKYEVLKDKNITWHFIGHLQRNKAQKVLDKISYLHSLDSLKLAELINKHCTNPLKCFVEVSINLEDNKNGVPYYEALEFIEKLKQYEKVEIVGLMMMAVHENDKESLSSQFRKLRELKEEIEIKLNISIPYLSMGMSEDYKIALKEGATYIRLGRILLQ